MTQGAVQGNAAIGGVLLQLVSAGAPLCLYFLVTTPLLPFASFSWNVGNWGWGRSPRYTKLQSEISSGNFDRSLSKLFFKTSRMERMLFPDPFQLGLFSGSEILIHSQGCSCHSHPPSHEPVGRLYAAIL